MTDKINNFTNLEIAAKQFQDAIVFAYNENCPLTVRRNNRNTSWSNQDLVEKRRKVRKLFNAVKKSGNWTDYERTSTNYNKALRQAKRESWRRHCEEIEMLQKVPDSTGFFLRMYRVQSAPFNLKMETMPQQRKGPWKNYSGSTSLAQK
jgi:hypothetical protein